MAAVVVLASLGPAALAGCRDQGANPVAEYTAVDGESSLTGPVLVMAAASLADAFGELAEIFEDGHPDVEVGLVLGASSSLREQVLAGAPVDVIATADEATMEVLVDAGELSGIPEAFATNRLSLAVPAGNPAGVDGLDDLADPDLLVGLCAPGVPCGDLARQALDAAGVEASVDTNEPDARALSTKLAAGELDAGIVYATDVLVADGRLEGLELPPAAADLVNAYPVAVLDGAPNPEAAAAFVALVRSEDGRRVLSGRGFSLP